MSTETVYLKDYKAPNYLIEQTYLNFNIFDDHTIVDSKLLIKPNYTVKKAPKLVLDGENLELISVSYNGVDQKESQYVITEDSLTLPAFETVTQVDIRVRIKPKENKALEGLYCSGDMYCTQNEPEGFRHITYYIDRPDNMSKFRTCIEADKEKYPVLLSNGNKIEEGMLADGRHYVEWEDPFAKPSYLFALVAGDLAVVEDSFVTKSGRTIPLQIFVNHGNEDRSQHSLDSLKKAMKWDEDVYGLEYDLDLYMIVAVNDFNSGAMENKGLNIFNSSLALANTETATDSDYHRIEGVIAHEYFHNWTGNRVTCRDWFQLTLKEGLTVFRDQEFSSDEHSRNVQRINDVDDLVAYQFSEDASKMSHPIQPSSYMEINNFYTSTVYNKGAEVIRMIHTIIGKDNFRKGMDKYFELNDGKAVTTEEFVKAMELASGVDLKQFRNWYSQSGTPQVSAKVRYSNLHKRLTITLKQQCEPSGGYKNNKLFHIPVRFGVIDKDGNDLSVVTDHERTEGDLIQMMKKTEKIVFENIAEKPVVSLLRGFSAPVELEYDLKDRELMFLSVNDSDSFNRRSACRQIFTKEIESLVADADHKISRGIVKMFKSVLTDDSLDNDFKVSCLASPSTAELIGKMEVCDYEGVYNAKKVLGKHLSKSCKKEFNAIYNLYKDNEFSLDDKAVGERKIKNFALAYLIKTVDRHINSAVKQMKTATNMTDEIVSLSLLSDLDSDKAINMVEKFRKKWSNDFLVMNKWFAVMAGSSRENVIDVVEAISKSDQFDNKNPNSLRYLYGSFAANVQFHDISGRGYEYIANTIIDIDQFNHKIAAGLSRCFKNYYKMDEIRKGLMLDSMKLILDSSPSKDVYEIVSKTLS
jgi:aminopeptidase N